MNGLYTERTSRRVIENKLLDSVTGGTHVAALLNEGDINLLLTALTHLHSSTEDQAIEAKCVEFVAALNLLKRSAFPRT